MIDMSVAARCLAGGQDPRNFTGIVASGRRFDDNFGEVARIRRATDCHGSGSLLIPETSRRPGDTELSVDRAFRWHSMIDRRKRGNPSG
jgi:hypothetical protein